MKLPIDYGEVHWTVRKKARLQYIDEQGGDCYHCGNLLTQPPPNAVTDLPVDEGLYPKNFFDSPIHLHHSHDTGLTIGAVHCYCNAVLWEYQDE
jgi:hypothetical protein